MTYSFDAQRQAWQQIPIDDVGYLAAGDLLALPDGELKQIIDRMWETRYDTGQRRNWRGKWVRCLNLDQGGRMVLDFGCGIGLDGLRMAKAGCGVVLADVNAETVDLAVRVFGLYGLEPADTAVVDGSWPYVDCDPVDEFYASGVIHHTPDAPDIIRRAAELAPVIRLMLYSDVAWWLYGREGQEVFVRGMDQVGDYADWYSVPRLIERFGEWAEVVDVEYITDSLIFLVATLKAV